MVPNNSELKSKYESSASEASRAYLDKQYSKAVIIYNDALDVASELKMGKMVICVLKYMISCCLFESNKLEDLSEAIMILQTLDKSLKERFPAVYCLLAQLHCKLYRFDCAKDTLLEADKLFKKNSLLELFYLPGTNIIMKQSDKEDPSWLRVRHECSTWHQPDAICSLIECNNVTKPYVTPNRNIYLSDPAFSGMVIVRCNNKNCQCLLKFHQSCWKLKKDQMYPVKKVSDKDILGDTCFTPNCMNDDTYCVIISIEVIGRNGELKAHIKETNNNNSWPMNNNKENKEKDKDKDKDQNSSKGAIKKVKPHLRPPPKMDNRTTPQKNSVSKYEIPSTKKNSHYYNFDKDTLLIVREETIDPDIFAYDPPDKSAEKNFLFSLFYYYIKKENVRVRNVYEKFAEIRENLFDNKNIDIMRFLLETEKFDLVKCNVPKWSSSYAQEKGSGNFSISQPNFSIPSEQPALSSFIYSSSHAQQSYNSPPFQENFVSPDDHENHSTLYDKNCSHNEAIFNKTEKEFENVPIEGASNDVEDLDYENMYQELIDDEEEEFVDCADAELPENFNNNVQKPVLDSNENYEKPSTNTNVEMCEAVCDAPSNRKIALENTNGYEQSNANTSEELNEDEKLIKDYIENLETNLNFKDEENKKLKKELEEKNIAIETLEESQEEFSQKVKNLHQLFKGFQQQYKEAQDENLKMKEEMINLIQEKDKLIKDLAKVNNPEMKRKELMKNFQEEYQILQDCINADWEKKTKELEESLKSELENKVDLLNKYLNSQYNSNKNLLNGCIDKCRIALEIINKINSWMEMFISSKQFADNSEWISRLHYFQKLKADQQAQYSKLMESLHLKEICNSDDVNLKLPPLPNLPRQSLNETLQNAFTCFYKNQHQIVQKILTMQQQTSMQIAQTHPQSYMQPYPYPNSTTFGLPALTPSLLIGNPISYGPRSNVTNPPVVQQAFIQQFIQHKQDPRMLNAFHASNHSKSVVKEVEKEEEAMSNEIEITETKIEETANKEKQNEENLEIETNEGNLIKLDKIDDQIDKMQNAVMAIKLNIEEKTSLEPITKTEKSISSTSSEKSFVSNTAATSVRKIPRKKISCDALVQVFKRKYPGVTEIDIVEAISEIRKNHNNSLTGIPVNQILKESETLIPVTQRLHVLRYQYNNASKSTHCESPQMLGSDHDSRNIISPASSCNSLNKADSCTSRKRTWNTISQEDKKWSADGEIECSICMNLIKKSNCYQLSCGHSFHTQCVRKWLESDRSCPNCRVMVTEDDDFPPLPA